MRTKLNDKDSELVSIFTNILGWHKARVKFLSGIILAMIKLQTINFVRLSQGFESSAKVQSNLRRIERFFADFMINEETIAQLLFAMLPTKSPHRLCLDRTNWKFGKTNINILIWKLLPKRGNSNYQDRTEIMTRYVKLFGHDSIASLMADREFIGENWFDELILHKIPFYIRNRAELMV